MWTEPGCLEERGEQDWSLDRIGLRSQILQFCHKAHNRNFCSNCAVKHKKLKSCICAFKWIKQDLVSGHLYIWSDRQWQSTYIRGENQFSSTVIQFNRKSSFVYHDYGGLFPKEKYFQGSKIRRLLKKGEYFSLSNTQKNNTFHLPKQILNCYFKGTKILCK